MLYRANERIDDAEKIFREVLAGQLGVLGETHLAVAWTKQELASTLEEQDHEIEATELFLDVVQIHREKLDDTNTCNLKRLTGWRMCIMSKDNTNKHYGTSKNCMN